jgi:hypothetical protein
MRFQRVTALSLNPTPIVSQSLTQTINHITNTSYQCYTVSFTYPHFNDQVGFLSYRLRRSVWHRWRRGKHSSAKPYPWSASTEALVKLVGQCQIDERG